MPTTPAAVTAVHHATTGTHDTLLGAIILGSLLYLLFHHHHYRRNRRAGHGIWVSLRGPFHTRISKEF